MLIMIDKGHIVFQEEKDALLDTYRIVKFGYEFVGTYAFCYIRVHWYLSASTV